MDRLEINAYTDGSCLGNPGVGGYAAILKAKESERICVGYSKNHKETCNRMELMAVINVVDWCNKVQKQPCKIIVNTDSKYLVNCSAHKRSWLTSDERPNNDLWLELIKKGLQGKHFIQFVKLAGQSGHELNERADKLAKEQAVKARHEIYG